MSAPAISAQVVTLSPKVTPTQQHARRDTRVAIAVPNLPTLSKPKASSPAAIKDETPRSQADGTTPTSEETQDELVAEDSAIVQPEAVKAPPKSWADLVRTKNAAANKAARSSGAIPMNGEILPKSASLADALQQYSVQTDLTLSFVEPRGLVNTGNMCYMNSVGTLITPP